MKANKLFLLFVLSTIFILLGTVCAADNTTVNTADNVISTDGNTNLETHYENQNYEKINKTEKQSLQQTNENTKNKEIKTTTNNQVNSNDQVNTNNPVTTQKQTKKENEEVYHGIPSYIIKYNYTDHVYDNDGETNRTLKWDKSTIVSVSNYFDLLKTVMSDSNTEILQINLKPGNYQATSPIF